MVPNGDAKMIKGVQTCDRIIDLPFAGHPCVHLCQCFKCLRQKGRADDSCRGIDDFTSPALFARRAKAYLTKYPDTQQPMVFIAFLSANPTVFWCILILCRRWQGVCCIRSFIIFISSHLSTPCRVVFVCFSMFFSGCEDGWFSCCRHQGLLQWFLGENGHYIIYIYL